MRLYPAIDILEGSAVRLERGDFGASTVYDADPLAAALAWVQGGAERLHVVDLDGARAGKPVNVEHLRRIASETGVPVQYGGGLRSTEALDEALGAGAERVVIGTAAMTDPEMLRAALAAHGPERVVVGIDVRNGRVATHGWLEASDVSAPEALEALRAEGVASFAFTDIDHDGMLDGPDLEAVDRAARAVDVGTLIVSGGIGTLAHLRSLAALRAERDLDAIEGVIVGKALYEHRFTVAEASAALAA
ncbi:MAG TPA: 1-(5-phosphoribosyl)-5-[(5-phosphoribosylamino)methylideneamino]imidazole-4-carboxamide isomerase [Solirubrobacteraceae bacterium]